MSDTDFVTQRHCGEIASKVLAKLEAIERRLFHDNGTLSIQTRIDRHEQILKGLLWVTSVTVGTALTAVVLGLTVAFRWAVARGGAP